MQLSELLFTTFVTLTINPEIINARPDDNEPPVVCCVRPNGAVLGGILHTKCDDILSLRLVGSNRTRRHVAWPLLWSWRILYFVVNIDTYLFAAAQWNAAIATEDVGKIKHNALCWGGTWRSTSF